MQRRKFIEKSLLATIFIGTYCPFIASCSTDDENLFSTDLDLQNAISGTERLYVINYNLDASNMKKGGSYKKNTKLQDRFVISGFIIETSFVTDLMKANKKLNVVSYSNSYSLINYTKPIAVDLASNRNTSSFKCILESNAKNKVILIKKYLI